MAYPFLRKIGVFINARIRRLHSPSPRFSYSSLNNVLQHTDTELINRSDWGTINFESARPDIHAALSIFRDLSVLPLEELTDNAINNIQASIPQVAETLKEIDEFSIASGGSPPEIRDNICNQLRGAVERLLD